MMLKVAQGIVTRKSTWCGSQSRVKAAFLEALDFVESFPQQFCNCLRTQHPFATVLTLDLTMTRNESDKEDLIRDATAMVHRAEFLTVAADHKTCLVTAGFRKDHTLSLYFDQDPFYQFDANGLLRRAFENGFLFRSQETTLARLNRTRTTEQTTLSRTDLNATELGEFRIRMTNHIECLHKQLLAGTAKRQRAVTDKPNFDSILVATLAQILLVEGPFLSMAINQRK